MTTIKEKSILIGNVFLEYSKINQLKLNKRHNILPQDFKLLLTMAKTMYQQIKHKTTLHRL